VQQRTVRRHQLPREVGAEVVVVGDLGRHRVALAQQLAQHLRRRLQRLVEQLVDLLLHDQPDA